MRKLFFSFNLLLWWINLIDFWMLKQPCVTHFVLIYSYIYFWILCINILLLIFLSSWRIFSIIFINIFVFINSLRPLFYNGCLFFDILLASALFMIISDIGVFNKMPTPCLFFEKYWKHKRNILLFLIDKDLAFLTNCYPQIIPTIKLNCALYEENFPSII